MPAIARTSIISGPAKIVYNSVSFWSKGDVTLKVINDRFNIDTAHFGKVDERFSGRRIEVQFEPSGAFTDTVAAVLWPYASTSVGTSVFTSSDKALEIFGRDGRKITLHCAAVTTMPQIRLAVNQTICGPVTFTGIVKNNTDPTNAAAYYTEAAVTYPGDTGFDVAEILTKHCTATWGGFGSSFLTEAGWTIDFNLQLSPQNVDGLGVVDMTFQELEVTASCIPVGPSVAEILSAVCPASALGSSVATLDDLYIVGADVGDPSIALTKAAVVESGLMFGNTAKRVSETKWIATRDVGSAIFSIAEVTV